MIWFPILVLDYRYRPTKTISPVGKGQEHAPGLSVCLYGLSFCDPACLLGFRAYHTTSMTGHAKNVPDPTSCRDAHHILSVTIPTCQGFHKQLFCPYLHDPMTFTTNPRVVGSVVGSAPLGQGHYIAYIVW